MVIRLLSPALSSDAAFRRQIRHDMGVLGALRHQHLLAVIAFDDKHAAVRLRVGGGGHARPPDRGVRPAAAAAALVVFDDVLAALEALHGAGIIHRDVTPGAVLLDNGGTGDPS